MSDFQTGVVVGVVLALLPIILGAALALVVQYQEKRIVDRARKAGL